MYQGSISRMVGQSVVYIYIYIYIYTICVENRNGELFRDFKNAKDLNNY